MIKNAKKLTMTVVAGTLALGMGGCVPYDLPNPFAPAGSAGVSTAALNQELTYETGTIQSVRYVRVQGSNEQTAGTLLGAATGAVLGHMIGKGKGQDLATIGGGLLGAYVGSQVTQANASELTIRTSTGRTVVIIVKGTGYRPGQQVRIVKSGSRVVSVEPL